jgi:hypothetical protein
MNSAAWLAIAVGYPDQREPPNRERKPLNSFVFSSTWERGADFVDSPEA